MQRRTRHTLDTPHRVPHSVALLRSAWTGKSSATAAEPAAGTASATGQHRERPIRQRPLSTATPSISVLEHVFLMPELERTRRILLYLPPDYANSQRRYPVLYMQDGQNVFDAATAFASEWGVDETLDDLHAHGDCGAIVVGVENGQLHRQDEYLPWRFAERFGGEGDAYVAFLADTLKPFIDARFRTLPDPAHTGVLGSSMGGVISLYAALSRPDVFGCAGVFSPSLWAAPRLYAHSRAFDAALPRPRLYFASGMLEGSGPGACVRDQERMVETLVAAGFRVGRDIEAVVRPDGTHSEGFWRREFPAAYRWMFGEERKEDELPPQKPAEERNCSWVRFADTKCPSYLHSRGRPAVFPQ